MASKAEKLRAKRGQQRGRPVKPDMPRTDSGRISRSKTRTEAADKVAKEARMRIFGVKAADAVTAQAATVIGRWSLVGIKGGGISSDQYEALMRFANSREQYMTSIQAPDSLRSKGGGGPSTEDDAEAKARIKRHYLEARGAIDRAQLEHRHGNLWAAVQYVVIDNLDLSHMIGDTRLVGNALDRHYQGLDRKGKVRQLCA